MTLNHNNIAHEVDLMWATLIDLGMGASAAAAFGLIAAILIVNLWDKL